MSELEQFKNSFSQLGKPKTLEEAIEKIERLERELSQLRYSQPPYGRMPYYHPYQPMQPWNVFCQNT